MLAHSSSIPDSVSTQRQPSMPVRWSPSSSVSDTPLWRTAEIPKLASILNGHPCSAYAVCTLAPIMEWYTTESPSVMAYMLGVSPTTCISDVAKISLAFCQTYDISVGAHVRVTSRKDFSRTTTRKSSQLSIRVPRARVPDTTRVVRYVTSGVHITVFSSAV